MIGRGKAAPNGHADVWRAHRARCAYCQRIQASGTDFVRDVVPATLQHACLEGARLFKDAANAGRRAAR